MPSEEQKMRQQATCARVGTDDNVPGTQPQ